MGGRKGQVRSGASGRSKELDCLSHTALPQRWEGKAGVNDVLVYRVYF